MIGSCNNRCVSVYIDGEWRRQSVTTSESGGSPGYWQDSYSKVPLLIAVEGLNYQLSAGIGVYMSTGQTTDETWKCSITGETGWHEVNFNDDSWEPPIIISSTNNKDFAVDNNTYERFPEYVKWIWDSNGYSDLKTVYCRGVIGKLSYS